MRDLTSALVCARLRFWRRSKKRRAAPEPPPAPELTCLDRAEGAARRLVVGVNELAARYEAVVEENKRLRAEIEELRRK